MTNVNEDANLLYIKIMIHGHSPENSRLNGNLPEGEKPEKYKPESFCPKPNARMLLLRPKKTIIHRFYKAIYFSYLNNFEMK